MRKKEIIKIIKDLRKEQNDLWKRYSHNIYISLSLKATTGEIMEVNPFALDLRTGYYHGRDLIDGEYKKVNFFK